MLNKLIIAMLLLVVALPSVSEEQVDADNAPSWAEDADTAGVELTTQGKDKASRAALTEVRKISSGIQSLKKEVIALNKELRLMEETLLFPSSTRFSVFVSSNSGEFFTLESIKFKLDGKFVATHVYSEKQRRALRRGGVQKLYITNLNQGKHAATAFFTGLGPNGRAYKRAVNLEFEKGPGSEYLELVVSDDDTTQEPVFLMKQW